MEFETIGVFAAVCSSRLLKIQIGEAVYLLYFFPYKLNMLLFSQPGVSIYVVV